MPEGAVKNPPLVRQDLDVAECGDPGCPGDHEAFVVTSCHPGAGLDVGYDKHTGCLNFYCHSCQSYISRVQVAEATVN